MTETLTLSHRSSSDEYTRLREDQLWRNFVKVFCLAASFQGGVAYFLMSIHAVNPGIIVSIFGGDPYEYIWITMIYGLSVMIMSRPSMRTISPFNRIAFGILGSLMFCHASRNYYDWLNVIFEDRPYIRTFMGFLGGRVMMVHLLAFLYHLDTRTNIPGVHVHRDRAFEYMYVVPEFP